MANEQYKNKINEAISLINNSNNPASKQVLTDICTSLLKTLEVDINNITGNILAANGDTVLNSGASMNVAEYNGKVVRDFTGVVADFTYTGSNIVLGNGYSYGNWNTLVNSKSSFYDVDIIPTITGSNNEYLTFDTPAYDKLWRIDFQMYGILSLGAWMHLFTEALDQLGNTVQGGVLVDDWVQIPSGVPSVFPFLRTGYFLFTPTTGNNKIAIRSYTGLGGAGGSETFTIETNQLKLTATLVV